MNYELSSGSMDDGVMDPEASARADVKLLVGCGITVAEAIADQQPFNYNLAELSLRNLAGLFNMFTAVDDMTMDSLGLEIRGRLAALSADTYDFLGDTTKLDARYDTEAHNPRTIVAEAMLLRQSFNGLQIAASLGTEGLSGYQPEQQDKLRRLVRESGQVFAGTYLALYDSGNPLATNPSNQSYFEDNIWFATPHTIDHQTDSPVAIHPDTHQDNFE